MPSRHDHYPRAGDRRCDAARAAAAALATAWAAEDDAPGGIATAMRALAGAPPAAAIAALAPWLGERGWIAARLRAALALCAADAFARPPLRLFGGGAGTDGGMGGIVLAEQGAIRLALTLRPFAAPAAASAVFVPGAAHVRVLAARGARIAFHRVALAAAEQAGAFTAAAAAPCISDPPRALVAGERFTLDTARTAFTFAGGSGDVLLLELTVQPPSPLPIRAYDVASGRLLHVAASRRDSSFRAVALTLLGAMHRTDAAPLFVREAGTEDFAARWHAARELAALAPAAAAPVLEHMAAADPHPEVRRAAKATLALFETPPLQRRGMEQKALNIDRLP